MIFIKGISAFYTLTLTRIYEKPIKVFTIPTPVLCYNVIHHSPAPSTLIQVGVRDYCEEEYLLIKENKKIHTFFDSDIKTALFEGETWKSVVDSIIHRLPEKVYISLDVDGLKPHLFPHTGTPVPGGMDFEQSVYLFKKLAESQKQIIGFDLVGNSGSRRKNELVGRANRRAASFLSGKPTAQPEQKK